MSLTLKVARMSTQGGRSGYVAEGGIFSSIGGALKKVAGAGLALATGGGVAGAVRAVTGGSRPAVMPGVGLVATGGGGPVAPPGMPLPGLGNRIARALPGGSTGLGTGCPQGYHPNRSNYFTRDGFVEKGSRCVKNRRRNPLNPRALDRSMGRLASAGKALKSLGFKAPTARKIAQKGKKAGKKG